MSTASVLVLVTTNSDASKDPARAVPGSLRDAIARANAGRDAADSIQFLLADSDQLRDSQGASEG